MWPLVATRTFQQRPWMPKRIRCDRITHMSTLTALTPKQQARALIDALPDNVTWSELAYRLEVRADIEEGLAEVKAGRVVSTTELRRDFGLPE